VTFENSILSANPTPAVTVIATAAAPTWRFNDVTPAGFSGMSDPTGSNGNMSVAPGFVSATDFHLSAGSPVKDAADPAMLDTDGTRADMGMFGGTL
jgi:hypothetical protein